MLASQATCTAIDFEFAFTHKAVRKTQARTDWQVAKAPHSSGLAHTVGLACRPKSTRNCGHGMLNIAHAINRSSSSCSCALVSRVHVLGILRSSSSCSCARMSHVHEAQE